MTKMIHKDEEYYLILGDIDEGLNITVCLVAEKDSPKFKHYSIVDEAKAYELLSTMVMKDAQSRH